MDRSPVYGRPVQFRVLGPLEVDAGEGPIPLGGPKQRAVLASLLVRANQVVPVDTLIDDIWGEDPPDRRATPSRPTSRTCARRSATGACRAVRPATSWSWNPSRSTRIGSTRSCATRRRPCPSIRASRSRRSTTRWRCGVVRRSPTSAEQPSLLAEAARLDELRLGRAGGRGSRRCSRRGARRKALGELEPLLARDPLRESLWGLADARPLPGRAAGRGAERVPVARARSWPTSSGSTLHRSSSSCTSGS